MKAFEFHQHEKKGTERGLKNDLRPDDNPMIGKAEELPPVSSKPWKNPTEKSEKRGLTTQLIDISRDRGNFTRPNKGEKSEFSDDALEWQKWPILDERALFGFAGEFVRLATEKSEADPAAVLVTLLTRFGVECDTYPYLMVGDTRHYARVFSVIVGKSSKARKGTSGKPVKRLFDLASEIEKHPELSRIEYETARTSPGPLSSGEGIIYNVRDMMEGWNAKKGELIVVDLGVADKRLFVFDEEFGAALSCTKREGNTLSTILRGAWDTGSLEPLTKTSPIKATRAHIGICTHITLAELHKKLDETEAFNGFANRFLWCCAKRSKCVPLPEPMPEDRLSLLQMKLVDIISKAQSCEKISLNGYAKEIWIKVYPDLSKDVGGLIGSVTNRAEAQVLRLSMIYTLLDGQRFITQGHLEAALALWRYCEASAKYIFFHRETNPHARKILKVLNEGPKSTTDLYNIFNRRIKKYDMDKVLQKLVANGRIEPFQEKNIGRPKTLFRLNNYL